MTEAGGASSAPRDRVSPYAAARLYADGQLSRDALVEVVSSWTYTSNETRTIGLHDDLLNFVPGSFDEVQAAYGEGLIDAPIYEAALGALRAQILAAPQTSRPIPGPACADE
jgi:hypothetical protein